jgi:hypothetical protein
MREQVTRLAGSFRFRCRVSGHQDAAANPAGRSRFSLERTVQRENGAHRLLARTFTADEIDAVKRGLGQVKDLARSALAVAPKVLELHRQGLGPVAIARELGVGRKSVARVIARMREN